MSETFSAEWLALRADADAAACSPALADRLAAWARSKASVRIVDLGAGTGAHLRRTAPRLRVRQRWDLVERDPALIAAGGVRLARAPVAWRYVALDLARDLDELGSLEPDLITASALLDLVSAAWLERLAELRRRTGAALYVVLTIDGRLQWRPDDPADAACHALVERHQRTDKGFGPALGPEATAALQRLLTPEPGELRLARSDWRLDADASTLQAELLRGYRAAAAAMAPEQAGEIDAWAERRARWIADGRSTLLVGHQDLLFLPQVP